MSNYFRNFEIRAFWNCQTPTLPSWIRHKTYPVYTTTNQEPHHPPQKLNVSNISKTTATTTTTKMTKGLWVWKGPKTNDRIYKQPLKHSWNALKTLLIHFRSTKFLPIWEGGGGHNWINLVFTIFMFQSMWIPFKL